MARVRRKLHQRLSATNTTESEQSETMQKGGESLTETRDQSSTNSKKKKKKRNKKKTDVGFLFLSLEYYIEIFFMAFIVVG